MGLDNSIITIVGVIVAAIGALAMAAMIGWNERSATHDDRRRRSRGPGAGG